jgi:hypothetical protein
MNHGFLFLGVDCPCLVGQLPINMNNLIGNKYGQSKLNVFKIMHTCNIN